MRIKAIRTNRQWVLTCGGLKVTGNKLEEVSLIIQGILAS